VASVTSSGSAIREGDQPPLASGGAEGRSTDPARWHLLLDSAPAALLLLRRAGPFRRSSTIGLANRAFGELAGVAAEALAGRGVRALRDLDHAYERNGLLS
jgi:PAS domain-containing protein